MVIHIINTIIIMTLIIMMVISFYDVSYICFFGDFTGGALVLEDGRRYEGKRQWHGPFDGASILHWNEPHEGLKYSVVAFTSKVRPADALIAQDADPSLATGG